MSLQFIRAKPVQAAKLIAIIVVLLFAAVGVFGVIPDRGFTGLFLIILFSLGLALVITAETLHAAYRSIRTESRLTAQFADRRPYTIVRAIEVFGAIASAGGFVFIISTLPDEAPAGPGAIGLLFMLAGVAILILVGSLARTLTEYYYHRNHAV